MHIRHKVYIIKLLLFSWTDLHINKFAIKSKHLTYGKIWSMYLQFWWLNLFPLRKHLFGVSTHSHAHLIGFSGWCFGQLFLQTHWHLSSSYSLLGPQEVERSLFLQTHWQDVRSRSLWGPQLEGNKPPLQTHWQVSSSNSLFGPQMSWKASEESTENKHKY